MYTGRFAFKSYRNQLYMNMTFKKLKCFKYFLSFSHNSCKKKKNVINQVYLNAYEHFNMSWFRPLLLKFNKWKCQFFHKSIEISNVKLHIKRRMKSFVNEIDSNSFKLKYKRKFYYFFDFKNYVVNCMRLVNSNSKQCPH